MNFIQLWISMLIVYVHFNACAMDEYKADPERKDLLFKNQLERDANSGDAVSTDDSFSNSNMESQSSYEKDGVNPEDLVDAGDALSAGSGSESKGSSAGNEDDTASTGGVSKSSAVFKNTPLDISTLAKERQIVNQLVNEILPNTTWKFDKTLKLTSSVNGVVSVKASITEVSFSAKDTSKRDVKVEMSGSEGIRKGQLVDKREQLVFQVYGLQSTTVVGSARFRLVKASTVELEMTSISTPSQKFIFKRVK